MVYRSCISFDDDDRYFLSLFAVAHIMIQDGGEL